MISIFTFVYIRGDLYQSWERGQEVFEELLLDADWSLNAGNWMWLSASSFFYQFFRYNLTIFSGVFILLKDNFVHYALGKGFLKDLISELWGKDYFQ